MYLNYISYYVLYFLFYIRFLIYIGIYILNFHYILIFFFSQAKSLLIVFCFLGHLQVKKSVKGEMLSCK